MADLTVADILPADLYEERRSEIRAEAMVAKARRRVLAGPVVLFTFESRDTVRYQIQEIARSQHLLDEDEIQSEIDAFAPLVPQKGTLTATMFIELTSDGELRHWLERLVGIENHVALQLADGSAVTAQVTAPPPAAVDRHYVTAAVHYLSWSFTPEQVSLFSEGPVSVVITHPAYPHEQVLSSDLHCDLFADLSGTITT